MGYIIWTMNEDEQLFYVGSVDWDTMEIEWTTEEADAGIFYGEEADELEDQFDYMHVEEVE